MVSKNREAALLSLWWSETNEKWTQEWRDGLNGEELALVESWDRRCPGVAAGGDSVIQGKVAAFPDPPTLTGGCYLQ